MVKIRGFEPVAKQHLKSYKTTEDVILPKRKTKKSSGYDFVAPYNFMIGVGETKIIWSDIKAYMLDDEELLMFIRSSTGIKDDIELKNKVGKIDCVPKGTLISTPFGDKKVEDLLNSNKKEIVLSYNEIKNEIEEDILTDMWIVNDIELIEIKTEDNDIIKIPLTKEVYTKRGWIKGKDLKLSDKILKL